MCYDDSVKLQPRPDASCVVTTATSESRPLTVASEER
jgi:hypothetical protein